MNFAQLKAKAAEAASSARTSAASAREPRSTTKYQSVRPEDRVGAGPPPTPEERRQQSTVLARHQEIFEQPPRPPPIRSAPGGHTSYTSSSTPPAQPHRTPSRTAATPPAPPPRSNSTSSVASTSSSRPIPAPPYQHAQAHDLPKPAPPPRTPKPSSLGQAPAATARTGFKRFSDYTTEDKEVMFGMLDEFFEQRLRTPDASSAASIQSHNESFPQPQRPMPTGFSLVTSTPTATPPPVTLSTRPSIRSQPSSTANISPSYPPSAEGYASSALAIARYILDRKTSQWWSAASPLPPPLASRTDMRYLGSFLQQGQTKTVLGLVIFGDASVVWWRVSFPVHDPNRADVKAKYRPVPNAWDGQRLYEAAMDYGVRLAAFARQAAAEQRVVGRGECWDVAADGLQAVKEEVGAGREPFPSIGRTHGHLLFYGRAKTDGDGVGQWRGGEQYVREGDVVEWRSVKIKEVGMAHGSYSTLGDPEHTAVILSAGAPTSLPEPNLDGAPSTPYAIAALVSLTVVEQSAGSPAQERTYDMTTMSEGEVWIYRPVALRQLVGTGLDGVDWDNPGCPTWDP